MRTLPALLILLVFTQTADAQWSRYRYRSFWDYYSRYRDPAPAPEPEPEQPVVEEPDPEPEPPVVEEPEPTPEPPSTPTILSLRTASDDGYNRITANDNVRISSVASDWSVAYYYQNSSSHLAEKDKLLGDAERCLSLAIVGSVENNPSKISDAVRMIKNWQRINSIVQNSDGPLVFAYGYPSFILAADLCRQFPEQFTAADQADYASWLRAILPDTLGRTMSRDNNWRCHGLSMKATALAYLGDDMGTVWSEWKFSVNDQLNSENLFWRELGRTGAGSGDNTFERKGLTYSSFALTGLTNAAVALQSKGYPAYGYSTGGKSLNAASKRLAAYYRYEFIDGNGENWPGTPEKNAERLNCLEFYYPRTNDPNSWVVINNNRPGESINPPIYWRWLFATD